MREREEQRKNEEETEWKGEGETERKRETKRKKPLKLHHVQQNFESSTFKISNKMFSLRYVFEFLADTS